MDEQMRGYYGAYPPYYPPYGYYPPPREMYPPEGGKKHEPMPPYPPMPMYPPPPEYWKDMPRGRPPQWPYPMPGMENFPVPGAGYEHYKDPDAPKDGEDRSKGSRKNSGGNNGIFIYVDE